MKVILILILVIFLQVSILVHIQNMIGYISTKNMKYFKGFMVTAVSNTTVAIILAIIVMFDRDILSQIKIDIMLIIESGIIFFYMVYIKTKIVMSVIKRLKDPENYHVSYFGKKVYHTSIVNGKEMMTFFITLPFTLFAGAYFLVRIIKL